MNDAMSAWAKVILAVMILIWAISLWGIIALKPLEWQDNRTHIIAPTSTPANGFHIQEPIEVIPPGVVF